MIHTWAMLWAEAYVWAIAQGATANAADTYAAHMADTYCQQFQADDLM